MTMPTDLLKFIAAEASADDLDRVIDAVKTRRQMLAAARAAAVQKGASVTLVNLSPKALNDLQGTVETITKGRGQSRADVRLTKESTDTLRWSGTRFAVPSDVTEYVVRGVPLTALVVND